jgi:hypothetical protein
MAVEKVDKSSCPKYAARSIHRHLGLSKECLWESTCVQYSMVMRGYFWDMSVTTDDQIIHRQKSLIFFGLFLLSRILTTTTIENNRFDLACR